MKGLFADGAYDRRTLLDKAAFLDFVVEVVRRTDTDPGFKVIPHRWVVERSIGWLTRYRRLVRDVWSSPMRTDADGFSFIHSPRVCARASERYEGFLGVG
jgi:transposase